MKLQRLWHPFPWCSKLLLLLLVGAEQHVFEVSVWPENPVVEHGGSLWLNCSTSCQEADARGGLETSLIKERQANGTGWAAFQLVNITEWASAPECFFSCYGEHSSVPANITVYQIPEQVQLDAMPTMQQGTAYNLTCRVPNVAPIRNLTVTLWKGEEKLHLQTFETDTAPEARNIVLTHTIVAQQDNHGQAITCRAALDLRPQGQLFEKASLTEVLKVFAFPMDPQLQTSRYIETGAQMAVMCDVTKLFPAEEAQFDLTFAGERLNFSINVLGDTAWTKAQASSSSAGEHQLNCTVSLGPVIKTAVEMVTVYSFPEPSLEIHPSRILANNPVNITCDFRATQLPGISLQIKNAAGRALAYGDQLPLQFTQIAQEEDDGREFVCEAELEIGGDTIVKRMSANLTVFYVPEMDESTCPSNRTWVEETLQTFLCMAKGNPKPSVICTKDGITYNVEMEQPVKRSHAGVYNCSATSELSSSTKAVTIQVEYGPQLVESDCPSHDTWVASSLQKLSCQADGVPSPEVSCMKDGTVYNVGRVQNVTQNHAGVYHCNATNVHGSRSKTIIVKVEYKPELDDSSCPRNWTLVEGTPSTFECKAKGVPTPKVVCTKDGISYLLSEGQGIPVHSGVFQCNATNRQGTVAKTVMVALETKPKMDEFSCPSNQTWLEGTSQSLICEANGTPTPVVLCMKEGAAEEYHREQNISRNDSGIYQCKATNSHGTEIWMVTVQVEYRPAISRMAVNAPLPIRRGTNFTITCHADGSPAVSFTWRVPQASNLNYAGNNSTVTIASADGQNSGVYECTASNKHGHYLSQVEVQVEDHWLYIIVVIAIAGATMLVLGGMAGVIYYLKSTACKKGEYNVRDAENSTEATCLNRERTCDSDIYGIQLTRT